MTDRQKKLEAIRLKREGRDMLVITDSEQFIKSFQEEIDNLKNTLGKGVELSNLEEILKQLEVINELQEPLKEIKKAVESIPKAPDFPKSIKVDGLSDIIKVLSDKIENHEVNVKWFDEKTASQIISELNGINQKLAEKAVQSLQNASDFTPVRRVVKVGERYFFDDNPTATAGGGGGSSSGSVQISGASGGVATVTNGKLDVNATTTIDTTGLATSAKQDTGNTSLASIDGKITAVNTGAVTISAALPAGNNNIGDVDVVSSALPSGAATAAKQPALGTAGTASSDVITVQGIASMTAIKTDGSGVTQPVSGTVTAAGAVADAASASGNPVPVGAIYESTLPTYTNGQRTTVHTGTRGSAHVQLMVPDSSTQVTFAAAADAAANPSVASRMETISRATVYNGSTWDRQRGSTTGTNVIGGLAHDAADTSANQPTKVGGQARTTNPTAVADADVANFITDKVGRQITVQSIRDLKTTATITITASTSETDLFAAGGAGVFLDLYFVMVTNTSSTATEVAFKDAAAGTTRFTLSAPANDTRGYMIGESGGWPQNTANNKWTCTAADSVSSLLISAIVVKNV